MAKSYHPQHAAARIFRVLSWRARSILVLSAAVAAVGGSALVSASASASTTCVSIPSGVKIDGVANLTAKVYDTAVSSGHTVDATGCDIGVYYDTSGFTLTNVTVENAKMAGVFVNGTSADVSGSTIQTIGDQPFGGDQYGLAVYYENSSGSITGNTISQYQKNGITVKGSGSDVVTVADNTVTGLGGFKFNAQNGIEIYGAAASPSLDYGNTVSGNIYTQGAARGYVATGMMIIATGTTAKVGQFEKVNTIFGNQLDIYLG